MRSKSWIALLVFWLIACCSVSSAMASVSWYKNFANQNSRIEFKDIAATNDGGSIAVGSTTAYPSSIIAFKFNKLGEIEWQKDIMQGVSVQKVIQASDGGFVVLGIKGYGYYGDNWYAYLIKVSKDGNGEWYTGFPGYLTSIVQADDGGLLLYNGSELVKINNQGNLVKKTQYKRPNGSTFAWQYWKAVTKTPEGDLLVAFSDINSNLTGKCYVARLKQDGTFIWQKEVDYSTFTSLAAYIHSINYTPDGGFIVGLSFLFSNYNAILKFDSTGQLQFQKKIMSGNTDLLLQDIIVTPDNEYLIAYSTHYIRSINAYVSDVHKFNSLGEVQWSRIGRDRRFWKKMPDDSVMSINGTPAYSSAIPNILSKTSNLDLSGCDPLYGSIPAPEISDFTFQVRDSALSASTYSLPPGSNGIGTYSTFDFTQPAPTNSCLKTSAIYLSSSAIDFGAAKLNQTVTKDLVITNSGDASLNIRQVHQPDSPNFTVSGTCSLLAPKASCTLTLTFTPTALGTVTGMLAIDSDDPYKPTELVALSGSSSDSIPPHTSYSLSGTNGQNGWFTTDVAVSLDATDADSGVDSITYSINSVQVRYPGSAVKFNVVEEKKNAITFFAVDNAGNQETATPLPVNIDKTAPTIAATVSSASNAAGWYNTNTTVSFACSDATSGIVECSPPVTLTSDVGGQVVGGKAVDEAGLTAETSVTINLDMTQPVITINGVQDGAKYPLGLVPTASYTVSDSLSGVSTSSATLTGGDGLGLGTFTYAVSASDIAGNTATPSVTYEVIATPEGLIALIRQMLASGKIDNAGIANSLIAKVENAQKANGNAADNIMQAFINQVEAQSGKHIASDAAAILIHAAEYIIGH